MTIFWLDVAEAQGYQIIYRVADEQIQMLTVIHGNSKGGMRSAFPPYAGFAILAIAVNVDHKPLGFFCFSQSIFC